MVGERSRGLQEPLDRALTFGSTTELSLKVVRELSAMGKPSVRLLAQNDPPDFPCMSCGKPSAFLCGECQQDYPSGIADAAASGSPIASPTRHALVRDSIQTS
ncbi:MAG: hypothetical protein HYY16_08430 [Planctomycetes bacterium]|nr:hypothetical protein [Planctomycetota bacterium]